MKTLMLLLLPIALLTGLSKSPKKTVQEQVLNPLRFSFHTNGDDKDWDTRIDVQVIYNGYVIGERRCCSVNGNDHWDNRSESPELNIPLNEGLTKDQLLNASYQVSIQANGNDKWDFDAWFHADFTEGAPRDWTFLNHSLNSRDSQWANNVYQLSDDYRDRY